jgi:8-oxo-dGTP pyrophosphatase MutT (NUDIX family)
MALPSFHEIPGLGRLAIRVARSHLGGPATVGTMCIVVREDGCVAFVKASYRKNWSMPGGYADRGEDPPAATVREVLEETGFSLRSTPQQIASRNLGHRTDYFFISMVASAAPAAPTTGWEISELRWCRWSDRPILDEACSFVETAVSGGVASLIDDFVSTKNLD